MGSISKETQKSALMITSPEGLKKFSKPFKKSMDDSFVEASFEVDLVAIE